ncbi:hypothetical protein HGM15179_020618, partial [Zosterops borbonicus]
MSVTSVRFYQDENVLGGLLSGTELSISTLQLHHSYHCEGLDELRALTVNRSDSARKETFCLQVPPCIPPYRVPAPPPGLSPVALPTVPVANATITPSPPAHQVHTCDPVTLRCSVQVGSAPVTFTWMHNGREVARGPILELGDVSVGHSGTYQCMATNQLGQDGHRVFRALSPELALEVTPQGNWNRAVAPGVGESLLFLVFLVGVVVGGHQWNNIAARKHQERAPPDSLAPPEEGEVLYTHVVSTKQMG